MTQRAALRWPILGGLMLAAMLTAWRTPSWAAAPNAPIKAQIAAGVVLYKDRCVLCHSENLAGGAGPPLKGEGFVSDWQGKPLRALYSRILMTMPANDPGSLDPQQVLTLVSYLASENALIEWSAPFKSADELSQLTVRNSK